VKRYAREEGSEWVRSIAAPVTGNTVLIAAIGMVEVAAALARMKREGRITRQRQTDYLQLFLKDADEQYKIISLNSRILRRAIDLTQRHKLRGYDAVHLATAQFFNDELLAEDLPPLIFVASDEDLLAAADAEGLAAINPAG
jgi:hypothetical protein